MFKLLLFLGATKSTKRPAIKRKKNAGDVVQDPITSGNVTIFNFGQVSHACYYTIICKHFSSIMFKMYAYSLSFHFFYFIGSDLIVQLF